MDMAKQFLRGSEQFITAALNTKGPYCRRIFFFAELVIDDRRTDVNCNDKDADSGKEIYRNVLYIHIYKNGVIGSDDGGFFNPGRNSSVLLSSSPSFHDAITIWNTKFDLRNIQGLNLYLKENNKNSQLINAV